MTPKEILFARLQKSAFRSRFKLKAKELAYIDNKGLDVIQSHAQDFIRERLAPAQPMNDGKQTPMHGHPVFIAQHATAMCCRECLAKWHGIAKGKELNAAEQAYILDVILTWIKAQMKYNDL